MYYTSDFNILKINVDNLGEDLPITQSQLDSNTTTTVPVTTLTSNKKGSFWKKILLIAFLSFAGFILSEISQPLLFYSLGSVYLPPPFQFITILTALLISPFGFDIILWIPLLIAFYYLFCRKYALHTSYRNLLMVIGVSSIIVIAARTGLFYTTVFLSKKYLSEKVSETIKQENEIVGTKRAIVSYVNSQPMYNSAGDIDTVIVTFTVRLPKIGTYGIDGGMSNVGYNPYDQKPDIYINSQKAKLNYETDGIEKEIKLAFSAQELKTYTYTELFAVTLNVWRTGIQLKQPFGGTMDWARVEVMDSGKSTNAKTINRSGVDEPEYTIGPFPLQQM